MKIVIANHSTINVGKCTNAEIVRAIREYDLANATPVDCMDFIKALKASINNGNTEPTSL